MQIESIAPDQLRSYANNARKHSAKQIGQIAKSIERFGFCNPVLIDGQNQIVAGHGRVAAAKILGMASVPVVRLEHLSETEKRAYILADNKLADQAGWDRELLAIELQGLADLDFDVELTGFNSTEVDLILGGTAAVPNQPREDAIPECADEAPVSGIGDLWKLGRHLLLCASPYEQKSYDCLLNGDKAKLVFAEPFCSGPRDRNFTSINDHTAKDHLTSSLTKVFARLAANSANPSIHMICADWRYQEDVLAAGRAVYSDLQDICVWTGASGEPGPIYLAKHEFIYIWKSSVETAEENAVLGRKRKRRGNVWPHAEVSHDGADEDQFRTIKPVALIADALRDASDSGDLILDPFAGHGTLLIAAEHTGRAGRSIEAEPRRTDFIVRRWQHYSGQAAVLVATGESFQERHKKCKSESALSDTSSDGVTSHGQ